MMLDNRTLLFAVALLELLCGLFMLTALGQRHGDRQRWIWVASFLVQGVGVGLFALRDQAPDWLTIPIANALFLLGSCLTIQAFARLLERPVPPLLALPATGVYGLLFCAAYAAGADLYQRLLLAGIWMGWLQGGTAWLMLRHSQQHPTQRVIGGWYVLMAGMVWALVVGLLLNVAPVETPVGNSPGRVFYQLCALGTIVASALGYLMIENELNRAELVQLAQRDSLTGALNRRALEMIAAAEWNRHVRYRLPLAVLMVDIDHFKTINDRYGHATGDQVLRHISGVLRGEIRRHEVMVRYGGEEFLILAPNTDLEGALQLAERILRVIRNTPFEQDIMLTASLGVAAAVPPPDSDWTALVNTADQRLYRAKAAGRDCIVAGDEVPTPAVA